MSKRYNLYPFQEDAVSFMVNKKRAINGMDMG